ncbi:Protein transport protein sec31 [Nosema granulosis]|uniref:Protein transport protein SEC31 n=1 Tax=Nosema granulosis TaxID=83296 RepID=A0A9P6H228_9MICR|nr:Protein transport protein sec31 [Nosema granulosis]
MKINKRCLSAFSKTKPLLALGTKSKLFDTTFSLTSELSIYNYQTHTHYPTLQLDRKFSKLLWCEKDEKSILATGHDNGVVSLYSTEDQLVLLANKNLLEKDVLGMDYNVSKNVLAAGSAGGKIIFWNLDKIDQQYKCDIPIRGNITCLSWNKKVSRILCAGTDDGRILVLDIRSKTVAMTLETPEVKIVSHVSWHPTNPTTIFASTNQLLSFNLSTDSMNIISTPTKGFDILDDSTLVSYSQEKVDYFDLDSHQPVFSSPHHFDFFDVSFSSRDPLFCISSSDGSTTLCGSPERFFRNDFKSSIFRNFIISKDAVSKINYPPLSNNAQDKDSILKKIYKDGKYSLDNSNRQEIGLLILNSVDTNLDEDILNLIKRDYTNLKGTVDLKFVVDLVKNCSDEKNTTSNNSLKEILLTVLFTGDYQSLVDLVSQWKIVVSTILFSDLSLDKAIEIFKKIDSKEPLLYLLTNQPEIYLSLESNNISPPSSIYEVHDFFCRFLPEMEKIQSLRIKSDNKYLEEFLEYSRDRGMEFEYLNSKNEDIVTDISNLTVCGSTQQETITRSSIPVSSVQNSRSIPNSIPKGIPSGRSIPKGIPTRSPTMPSCSIPNSRSIPKSIPNNTVPTKQLYSNPLNRSVSSLINKTVPPPPSKGIINTPSSGFITRPPSLYSCSSSGSTPNLNKKESVPTYGSIHTPNNNSIPNIPKPGRKPVPTTLSPSNTSIPKPGQKQTVTETASNPTTPVANFSQELLDIYENLKEQASKKNNLIIGNKIKDATRRFSIFLNLDKESLTKNVLYRISLLVQTFRDVEDKNLLKQSVRTIVEESIDLQENQCNIWIPAIYTLVQLVY